MGGDFWHNGIEARGSLFGKKILIVEDHPDMRELLSQLLELMGFFAIRANHAQEGVEKAIAERPQMILMDIMTPSIDGREAVRLLRSNPRTREIPILAMTALFNEGDLKSCIEAGCDGYVVKPFKLRELQAKIQELIPAPALV